MKQKIIRLFKKTTMVLSLAVLVSLIMHWFFTPLPEDIQFIVFLILMSIGIMWIVHWRKIT